MRRLLPLAFLLILPIALSACGGGGDGGQATVSQDVPATGGIVSLGDDVTLVIPDGALAAATTVTITKASDETKPPSELEAADSLGFAYDIDLGGQTLAKPVTLEIAFDPEKMASGMTADEAFLAYFDGGTKTWVPVGGQVDTARNVIVIQTDHLSWWNPFSWNLDYLTATLRAGLALELKNFFEGVQQLTTPCVESAQTASVNNSRANGVIKGCITKGGPQELELRLLNLKPFPVGISASIPGAPPADTIRAGGVVEFTASVTDQSPITVYAALTEAALQEISTEMWFRLASLTLLDLIPSLKEVSDASLKCVSAAVGVLFKTAEVSQSLDRGEPPGIATMFDIISSDPFLAAILDNGPACGTDVFGQASVRLGLTAFQKVLDVMASSEAILTSVSFVDQYLTDWFSPQSTVVEFSWRQEVSTPPAVAPQPPGATQNPDYDNDGIPNTSDACPGPAETWNNYQDYDGCPDTSPAPTPPRVAPTPVSVCPPPPYEVWDDDLIIQYRPGVVPANVAGKLRAFGVISQEQMFDSNDPVLSLFYVAHLEPGTCLTTAADQIRSLPEVASVEFNGIVTTQ